MRPLKPMSEILPSVTFAVGVDGETPPVNVPEAHGCDTARHRARQWAAFGRRQAGNGPEAWHHLARRLAPHFFGRHAKAWPKRVPDAEIREAGYTTRAAIYGAIHLGDVVNLVDLHPRTLSGVACAGAWVQTTGGTYLRASDRPRGSDF